MKTLIIYAHPWEQSFNHFVLEEVKQILRVQGKEFDIIDLNKDGFDPVMGVEDLKLFGKGEYHDPLAENYVSRLVKAEELVMIFPIWWYGEPAILKGFYDKVFLKGHVYKEVNHTLQGLLKAKKATILTTASITKEYFIELGNPVQNVLCNAILRRIGITDTTWIHCPTVYLEETRVKFLEEIKTVI